MTAPITQGKGDARDPSISDATGGWSIHLIFELCSEVASDQVVKSPVVIDVAETDTIADVLAKLGKRLRWSQRYESHFTIVVEKTGSEVAS